MRALVFFLPALVSLALAVMVWFSPPAAPTDEKTPPPPTSLPMTATAGPTPTEEKAGPTRTPPVVTATPIGAPTETPEKGGNPDTISPRLFFPFIVN